MSQPKAKVRTIVSWSVNPSDTMTEGRAHPDGPNRRGVPPHPRSDRVTMTVPEAASVLGLSESATYEAAARGEIPAVRIGRRVLIKRDQLLAMFAPSKEEPPR